MTAFRILVVALVVALGLSHVMCQSVPLTAPPNSEIQLIANPRFIAANGGVSRIVAIVTEPAGTPVADGTVVFFVTDLGRIDEQARTNDGIAQVNLIGDSRSGTATVLAFSGGAAVTPTTTASTLAAPTAPTVGVGSQAAGAVALMDANSATITVDIGNVRTADIQIRAEPTRIGGSRTTTVIATVFDEFGNTVANVPVYFRVTDTRGLETFDNAGPIFTDNNGEARSTLRTRRDFAGDTTTVEAQAPGEGGLQTSETLTIPVF